MTIITFDDFFTMLANDATVKSFTVHRASETNTTSITIAWTSDLTITVSSIFPREAIGEAYHAYQRNTYKPIGITPDGVYPATNEGDAS
jgi:hypothetical protein